MNFGRKLMVYRRGHTPGVHFPEVKSSSFDS